MYDRIDMCEGAVPEGEICTTVQLYQITNGIRVLTTSLYYYWQNDSGISHGGYTNRHKKGLENYINLCEEMIVKYPNLEKQIAAYFCQYEMAVMTTMCRNDKYDTEVIKRLQNHLLSHLNQLLGNKDTALYYKVSAILIIINYKVFSF